MRGEQCFWPVRLAAGIGSPPLARGTGRCKRTACNVYGITPACAGNRVSTFPILIIIQDHPRLRGEQSTLCTKQAVTLGSPPLARGTEYPLTNRCCAQGITPACAGNSRHVISLRQIKWDHPRLRGEQVSRICRAVLSLGSPPLARGTVVIKRHVRVHNGITPACAGNSYLVIYQCHKTGDHPRLRGEQPSRKDVYAQIEGSPPLARGTEMKLINDLSEQRITPACAGNRKIFLLIKCSVKDHPRLRGEQLNAESKKLQEQGSPPLARGTEQSRDMKK